MDATWFAVDLDGNVAVFDSGEAGAVPTTAYVGDDPAPEDAFAELEQGPVRWDLDGFRALRGQSHVDRSRIHHMQKAHADSEERFLLFAPDTIQARKLLSGAGGTVNRASSGIAFVGSRIALHVFEEVHAGSLCLGCYSLWSREPTGALYVYEHTGENWIAAPYARSSSPERPVKASALPNEILEYAIRFEGRFADTPELQPVELWKCESWMPGWLATDHKTVRPFEGKEDDFESTMDDSLDGQEGLEVLEAQDAAAEAVPFGKRAEETKKKKNPWWRLW
jgi:hypothetical protein